MTLAGSPARLHLGPLICGTRPLVLTPLQGLDVIDVNGTLRHMNRETMVKRFQDQKKLMEAVASGTLKDSKNGTISLAELATSTKVEDKELRRFIELATFCQRCVSRSERA